MKPVTVSTLKTFDALKNVPDDQLQWLIDNSHEYLLQDGHLLTVQGQPMAGPHFIINGQLNVFMDQNGSRREITTFNTGDITGYLPYSRAVTANVNSAAVGELHLVSFPTERLREMIRDRFELTQALVHVMSNRVREF